MIKDTRYKRLHCSVFTPTCTKGFTLIEIVLYVVLFSVLLSTSVTFANALFDMTRVGHEKLVVESEGNFVLDRIRYLLLGLRTSDIILGPPLMLVRQDKRYCIYLDPTTQALVMSEGVIVCSSATEPLTSKNVRVSTFESSIESVPPLSKLTIEFMLQNKTFSLITYLK